MIVGVAKINAMASSRHYNNAPITEAIVDLQVTASPDVRLSDLNNAHDRVIEVYPTKATRNLAHGRIRLGKEVSASASSEPIGLVLTSGDGRNVFQARLDGFTMSRLAPYQHWESFRDESRRLWSIYREIVKPTAINRVAVRYINRIDIPIPFDDLSEYLRTLPQVSTDLPQTLSNLFMQLTIPQIDINSMALLTEALVEPARPDAASIALDIDLFRSADLSSDEEWIWDFFETLRDRKNKVFEACITDKARELFS